MDVTLISVKKVSLLKSTAHPPKWVTWEPVREKLMIDTLSCFLQRDDVHFHRNLLLDGSLLSKWGSWIPVVDAESFLYGKANGHAVVEMMFLRRDVVSSGGCFAYCARAFRTSTTWRSKNSFKFCLQEVKPSRMKETSSS